VGSGNFDNERWRLADQAANCLSIDREVCRRAFYQEPEERVHRVIRWVISERNLPGHDFERIIEGWSVKHGAGVYGEDHRHGSLKRIEGIVAQTILGEYDAAA